MFTVCPKCALTLVVTAADLRVAQGYVRCGRCSNVFNALARLSEDRNAAAAANAQSAPAPGTTGIHPQPTQPAPAPPAASPAQAPAAPSAQPPRPPQPTASYTYTRPETPAPKQPSTPAGRAAPTSAAAPPQPAPRSTPDVMAGGDLDDDEGIPEDALEFNPAAGDVNKVFVEPPPNPEWTAATGTFKALVFKNEDSEDPPEIELDADFLSSTAEMRRLKMGLSESDSGAHPKLDENNMPGSTAAEPTRQRPAAQSPGAQTQFAPSGRSVPAAPRSPAAPLPPARPLGQSQPQLHAFLSETQSQPRLRPSPSETQSQPQLRSAAPSPESDGATADTQAEPRATGRKSVRAFGLDSLEPPPSELRLATLARSRIAPSSLELEPQSPLSRLTQMLSGSPSLWTSGVALLAFLLVAQIVNHYRNDLAATPQFNKTITALYSALGVKLTPHWDLRAYDVRQLGASVDAQSAGQIMVRASVKNGGRQAQPMPLLRVTLQDRFGNRIAARDVAPGNYLPRAIPAASFLSAGQRIDAEMAFVDPGANAVGFEIDACLPAPAGGIACANDPIAR